MKMKGQPHSGGAHGRVQNNNNNNNTSSSASMREAERRLSVILKSAKKMSFTSDELLGLDSAKKLTQGYRGRYRSWFKHILPVFAGLFALLMVYLLVYSFDDQGFGCLRNTSETVVVTKESVPVTPRVMTAPRVSESREDQTRRDQEHQDQETSPGRWVASNGAGQSLRKER